MSSFAETGNGEVVLLFTKGYTLQFQAAQGTPHMIDKPQSHFKILNQLVAPTNFEPAAFGIYIINAVATKPHPFWALLAANRVASSEGTSVLSAKMIKKETQQLLRGVKETSRSRPNTWLEFTVTSISTFNERLVSSSRWLDYKHRTREGKQKD